MFAPILMPCFIKCYIHCLSSFGYNQKARQVLETAHTNQYIQTDQYNALIYTIQLYEWERSQLLLRKSRQPLFFLKHYEAMVLWLKMHMEWLFIVKKIVYWLLLVVVFFAIYIITDIVFPVPSRIKAEVPTDKLSIRFVTFHELYTGQRLEPKSSQAQNLSGTNLFTQSLYDTVYGQDWLNTRQIYISTAGASMVPVGFRPLQNIGIGEYPKHLELMVGTLVSPMATSHLKSLDAVATPAQTVRIAGISTLQFKISLLAPPQGETPHICRLVLRDATHMKLYETTMQEPKYHSQLWRLESAWDEVWLRLFPNTKKVDNLVVTKDIPVSKNAVITDLYWDSADTNNKTGTPDITDTQDLKLGSVAHQTHCVFSVGNGVWIAPQPNQQINPNTNSQIHSAAKKPHGVLYILVDTMRADVAYNPNLLPVFNQWAKNQAITFANHRSQGNMTIPGVMPMMTGYYARQIGPAAFIYGINDTDKQAFYAQNWWTLPKFYKQAGYQVAGIGSMSLFSEAMPGGLDIGFHDAIVDENPDYEARNITNDTVHWLEHHGDKPFFLYVHYNTLHGPYRPPLYLVDWKALAKNPTPYNWIQQSYKGVGRYWDQEFQQLLWSLNQLGLYDTTDIIVTADHGAQIQQGDFGILDGVNHEDEGAYSDKGHTMYDEELRVPFVYHLAGQPQTYGWVVTAPTGHIDVAQSLSHRAYWGGDQPTIQNPQQGLNWFSRMGSQRLFDAFLHTRHYMYLDGHRYTGMLLWDLPWLGYPMLKYIRQLVKEEVKMYPVHGFIPEKISWFAPEQFEIVSQNKTTWESYVSNTLAKSLRSFYITHSPLPVVLQLDSVDVTTTRFIELTIHDSTIMDKTNNTFVLIKATPNTRIEYTMPVHSELVGLSIYDPNNIPDYNDMPHYSENNYDSVVACPRMIHTKATPYLSNNSSPISIADLVHSVCIYNPPTIDLVKQNYPNQPVWILSLHLQGDSAEMQIGNGAGETLKEALKAWGYAK
jgi:arylsulfatase A-like enzyme